MTRSPTSDSTRRLLYYYDGWGPFLRGGKPENLRESIDILADSQITTVLLSPNIGQSVSYPSDVSELSHWRPLSPETDAILKKGMGPFFTKVTYDVGDLWRKQGIDSFRLMSDHARSRGLEVFTSIRMNDVHMLGLDDGKGPYTDPFYRAHPEWRIPPEGGAGRHGVGAMNYAIPEVRAHKLAVMEELLQRYDFTGLELDFVRGPPFFESDRSDLASDANARHPQGSVSISTSMVPPSSMDGMNWPSWPIDLSGSSASNSPSEMPERLSTSLDRSFQPRCDHFNPGVIALFGKV